MMQTKIITEDKVIGCINCITGKTEEISFKEDKLTDVAEKEIKENGLAFIGSGLIDLQINGINGIDFNTTTLTQDEVVTTTHYLLSQGVTTFLPTIITNSDENILKLVHTIAEACKSNSLVNECVWGIHLEGPFISPKDGAKGAHDEKYIKAPDWELFSKFQETAWGKIKLVTIAPEWEGSCSFIEKCREQGILVAMGHSLANTDQISAAVKAGMTLSTHLGNGIPLLLKRHPNMIWDQLAADELYACIITDGIHIPDSFIKVVMKNKAKRTLVVSDATCYAGMPPGEYQSHIGGSVILDEEKRVSLKSSDGILAGAAKSLLENVETLMNHNLATLKEAWEMASINVADMLVKYEPSFYENNNDKVIFRLEGKNIVISTVIKNGKIVFENKFFNQ
jgi:N-acetylglucosamine-6-phosphate deacetylase